MKRLSSRSLQLLMMLALAVVLTLIITQPTGAGVRVNPGEVARTTYKSPRTVTYKSQLKTQEAEQRSAEQVAPILRSDLTAASQQDSKITATVTAINAVRAADLPQAQRSQRLQQILPLTADEAVLILSLDAGAWDQVQQVIRNSLSQLQSTQIKPDDIHQGADLLSRRIPADLPRGVHDGAVAVGKNLLIPNLAIDEDATTAAKSHAKDNVEPISYTVERDQILVSRGQVLSPFDVERLTAVGLTRPAFNWQKSIGVFLLVLLFATLLLFLAPRHARKALYPRRIPVVLALFAIGTTLAGVIITPSQPIFAYVLPLAAPALLLAIFYGFSLALLSTISLSAFFALASGGSFELFFIHLAASTAAILFARRVNNIVGFLQAGVVVAIVVLIGMTAFNLLSVSFTAATLPKFFLASALNGALTATFVFAGAAFLARPLGSVTFLQLLELENPRQPLLRKLANEMPGTYSHSLRIARLVESVAEEVGADALLARVQALYHDIGKSTLAEYFVENQQGVNPHSDLSPKESVEILRAHISEGLALAQKEGIPEQVAAAIPEHHGTFVMGYFYQKAKQRGGRVNKDDFRYFGPKPRSRETALLMLADAAESASRTLDNPTEDRLKALIQSLITERIDDGQLDEAPLSTYDLTVIKEVFARVLISDMHKRIKYPGRSNA